MQCCCPHSQSAGRCFSRFARRYRRRFEKRGFEPSQRQLLEGLAMAGYHDRHLLEVGSGVGYLHQTLLERGAASAVGVELAAAMVSEAQDRAAQRELSGRVNYLCGDFIELLDGIRPAEVTILDKVVCCYPDAEAMVQAALSRTQEVLALTYPRDRWYTRFGVAAGAMLFRALGSAFRPYVHDPRAIEQWIHEAGFRTVYQNTTLVWLTQVYQRN